MNTKLTLTVDDAVIEQAKAYAKEQGRCLSETSFSTASPFLIRPQSS